MSLNVLIVEGNNPKDSEVFIRAAKATCSENLKNVVLKLEPSTNVTIINPNNDNETNKALENMDQYNGIIFTGGAMRLNDMTDEIKKHINFASNCFEHNNKILAICWGLQVCSTAAGGKVAPGKNGAHIGIATDVEINEDGKKNLIYKNKKPKFNTPAFNFDEVVTMPKNSILLASNSINNVQGLNFKVGNCNIWGLQYHPEITYNKMINLIIFRKKRLLEKGAFKDENEIDNHIKYIETENNKLDKVSRMRELENWLDYLNLE